MQTVINDFPVIDTDRHFLSFPGKGVLMNRIAQSLTQRHRGVVTGVLLACVSILLFNCQMETNTHEDTGFIPVGDWASAYDSYTITDTTLDYFMAGSEYDGVVYPDTVLKGTIAKAVDFSDDSGVLIIKESENTYGNAGKYTGVYYRAYTSSTILLASAVDENYNSVETDTLSQALSVFTVDNVDTHVTYWGSGYTK
ncbi:MAG: hypothetical protein FWF29_03280 [Treponema sp.]|nr:hypothetical protein [Treponema sp.]